MELFKDFGFEPTFFFAQIVNFLIIAFVFQKFLYKPVLKTLKDRKKTIEQGLKDAADAASELEKAEARKDEIIREATIAAEKIIDETKMNAADLKDSMLTQAKSESEKIISEAKEAAEAEFKNARKDAEYIALDLSRNIVNKIMSEMFTKEEKAKIMARNVKRLENVS